MNRNAERGRATRERILDVATRLFAEDGYEDTSIEAVLREAGVSRGSLYHHFAGKDALFYGVLEQLEERIFAELMAASEGATNAGEVMRAGARAWLRLAVEPATQRIMLIDAPAVLGWERWRQFDEDHMLGEIRQAMAAAAEAGAIATEHVDVFAHILLAAVNEVALMISRADDVDSALTAATAAMDEFLRRLLGE